MEIIPDLGQYKVNYHERFHYKTKYNFELRAFEKKLSNKLPNEFKNALKYYNHRNSNAYSWYIDSNDYFIQ